MISSTHFNYRNWHKVFKKKYNIKYIKNGNPGRNNVEVFSCNDFLNIETDIKVIKVQKTKRNFFENLTHYFSRKNDISPITRNNCPISAKMRSPEKNPLEQLYLLCTKKTVKFQKVGKLNFFVVRRKNYNNMYVQKFVCFFFSLEFFFHKCILPTIAYTIFNLYLHYI